MTKVQQEANSKWRGVKLFGFVGANRSGKSVWGAAEVVGVCIGHDPSEWGNLPLLAEDIVLGEPRMVWCITTTLDKSRTFQQRSIWERVPRCMLAANCIWRPQTGFHNGVCAFRNGSIIKFKSAEQNLTEFESEDIDLAWIDETIPMVFMRAILTRTIDRSGHIVWTTIPDSAELHDVFVEHRMDPSSAELLAPEDVDYIGAVIYDNPHLPRKEIERAIRMWGRKEAEMRALGRFVLREGLVYPEFNIQFHVEAAQPKIPATYDRSYEPEEHWTLYEVIDPGIRNPCAVLFAGVDGRNRIHVYDEIYERNRTPVEIAAMIYLKRWKWYGLLDPVAYMRVEELLKRDYDENIGERRLRERDIRRAIEHGLAEHGACAPEITLIDPSANQRPVTGGDTVSDIYNLCGIWTVAASNDKPAGIMRVQQYLRGLDGEPMMFCWDSCKWFQYEITHYRYKDPSPKHSNQYLGDREQIIDVNDHLMDCLYYLALWRPGFSKLEPPIPPRHSPAGRERELLKHMELSGVRGQRQAKA